jgi:hypothetical protein
LGIAIAAGFDQSCVLDSLDIELALPWCGSSTKEFVVVGWSHTRRRPSNRQEQPGETTWRHPHGSKSSHGQPLLSVARQIASTSALSPRFSSADPASNRNGGRSFDNLSPYGAHFFRVVASAASPEAL